MRFRKKPVVIEATQIPRADCNSSELQAFLDWLAQNDRVGRASVNPAGWVDVATLKGVMRGNAGDWLIRGVAGEIYPCKPDIFAATYEPADKPFLHSRTETLQEDDTGMGV